MITWRISARVRKEILLKWRWRLHEEGFSPGWKSLPGFWPGFSAWANGLKTWSVHTVEMEFQPRLERQREHAQWGCFLGNTMAYIYFSLGWNLSCDCNNILGWNLPCYHPLCKRSSVPSSPIKISASLKFSKSLFIPTFFIAIIIITVGSNHFLIFLLYLFWLYAFVLRHHLT